jgi:hypothetical protein
MKTLSALLVASLVACSGKDDKGAEQRQRFELTCRNQFHAGIVWLRDAEEKLGRGEDDSFSIGAGMGTLESTFLLCFRNDPEARANPAGLVVKLDANWTADKLETFARTLEDGFAKSAIGASWQGSIP